MTDEIQKKPKRSAAALKAYLQARLKELDSREDRKIKKALERLAKETNELAVKRPGDPKIGQAAGLLTTAAATIQVTIPQ